MWKPDRNRKINIGLTGENLVTEVAIPLEGLGSNEGQYILYLQRPKDTTPYPVVSRLEGEYLIWTVLEADTEQAGTGRLTLRWDGQNGEVGKRPDYIVNIMASTNDPVDPADGPYSGFARQIAGYAKEARKAADEATAALEGAQEGKEAAEAAREQAQTAKTGAENAQTAAAQQELTATKQQLTETKAALATTQEDFKKAQRAIQFQAELNKGQTWDFEEDDQEAYQRQVPSGAKAGAVMAVGGKTVGWNQYLSINNGIIGSNLGPSNMTIITHGDVVTGTIVQSMNSNGFVLRKLLPEAYDLVSNHMYLMLADLKYTTATTQTVVRFQTVNIAQTTTKQLMVTKTWQNLALIAKMITTVNSVLLYVDTDAKLSPGDTVELRNPLLVDLTILYGPGNEPTDTTDPRIAQIEAYAAAHPEYNAGELISALVDEVRVRGANIINIQALHEWWPNDTVIVDDVFYVKGNTVDGIYAKHFPISIPAGSIISAEGVKPLNGKNMAKNARISFVYSDGKLLSCIVSSADGTPKKAENKVADKDIVELFMDCSNTDNNGFFGITNLMARLPSAPTAYFPYHLETYPIPSAVQSLPGYGWSAGSVANTIERTENGWQYVQRVETVDLGALDYTKEENTFRAKIQDMQIVSTDVPFNGRCKSFISIRYRDSWTVDGTMSQDSSKRLVLIHSGYSDIASFLSYVRGTPLYYELATPITTDITDLMGDSLAPFAVEAGGSITLHHPAVDDGFTIDVPAKVQYITKLSEVSANG